MDSINTNDFSNTKQDISLPPLEIEEDDEHLLPVEAPRKAKPADSIFPLQPLYCGVCSLPPEYCIVRPKAQFELCWPWLLQHSPQTYPDIPKWMENKRKQEAQRKKNVQKAVDAKFVRWFEIPAFHSLKAILHKNKDLPTHITYKGKIKLHGSNASVSIQQGGKDIFAQRRNGIIPSSDNSLETNNFDFSKFVYAQTDYWKSLWPKEANGHFDAITVFGEWCGKGINNGAAICTLPTRHFAIFAILFDQKFVMSDPNAIEAFLTPTRPKEIVVIPYIEHEYTFDFCFMREEHTQEVVVKKQKLQQSIAHMNDFIAKVDKEDPFVKDLFGISGVGEGAVYYPSNLPVQNIAGFEGLVDHKTFGLLIFKAKGKSHRVQQTKDAAMFDPMIAQSISQYLEMFVTDQRCEQGLNETCLGLVQNPEETGTDRLWKMEDLATFTNWMSKDIKKEGAQEMGKLNPNQLDKAVKAKSAEWFETKMLLLGIAQAPQ